MARLLYLGLLVAVLAMASVQAQPNPLPFEEQTEQANRAYFNATDFTITFPGTPTAAGAVIPRGVGNYPALGTLPGDGISQGLIELGPCAVSQPHVHPRGTEVAYAIYGTAVVGFREENGGRFLTNTITPGQSFVFPQGLIHFVQNAGCTPIKLIAAFSNKDAGTQQAGINLFELPISVLRATFNGISEDILNQVAKSAIATANPSQDPVCVAQCQAAGQWNWNGLFP